MGWVKGTPALLLALELEFSPMALHAWGLESMQVVLRCSAMVEEHPWVKHG